MGDYLFVDLDVESYYRLLHPRPVVVITSLCSNKKGNAMACSWFTPVSEEPPIISIAVAKENYTCDCIKHCKEFAVNILPADLYEKVWFVGSRSGRSIDKLSLTGFNIKKGKKISVPIIEDSLGVIEARVINEVEAGECILFLGEVVAVYVRENVVTTYGWNLNRVQLLLHGWGRVFYVMNSRSRRLFAGTK